MKTLILELSCEVMQNCLGWSMGAYALYILSGISATFDHIRMNWENMCLSYVNGLDNNIQLWCGNYVQNRQVFGLQRLLLLIFPALGLYLMFGLFRIQFRLFYSRVDNIRHTSGYFFIENYIMAEIFKPSDKIKLIFILF